jgi:hypothetical protein
MCSVGESFLIAHAEGPSFGHLSIGTSSLVAFDGLYVCNFTSPADLENITQIEVYLATDGTTARAVLYSDNKGAPNVLLAESAETIVVGTSGTWVSFNVSYTGTPNTIYWIGAILYNAGRVYYSPGVSGRTIYSTFVTDTPRVFTPENISPASDLSVYAVYAPSTTPAASDQSFNWSKTLFLMIAILGLVAGGILELVYLRTKKKK